MKKKMKFYSGRPEGFKFMFDVEVNADKWLITSVGKDKAGHYIFLESVDYAMGASIATNYSYAILTDKAQYLEYLEQARVNKQVSPAKYEQFLAAADDGLYEEPVKPRTKNRQAADESTQN